MSGSTVTWDLSECSIPSLSPVCSLCVHWRLREGRTCAAFPEPNSIPLAIWRGENHHRAPFPGDHGIQFEAFNTEYVPPRSSEETPVR